MNLIRSYKNCDFILNRSLERTLFWRLSFDRFKLFWKKIIHCTFEICCQSHVVKSYPHTHTHARARARYIWISTLKKVQKIRTVDQYIASITDHFRTSLLKFVNITRIYKPKEIRANNKCCITYNEFWGAC